MGDLLQKLAGAQSLIDTRSQFRGNLQDLYEEATLSDSKWREFVDWATAAAMRHLTEAQMVKLTEWARATTQVGARELLAQKLISIAAGGPFDETEIPVPTTRAEAARAADMLTDNVRQIEQRIVGHRKKAAEFDIEFQKLKKQKDTKGLEALRPQMIRIKEELDEMDAQLAAFKIDTDNAAAQIKAIEQHMTNAAPGDPRDIDITVGYLAYPSRDRGPIPIYPAVELFFPGEVDVRTIPSKLLLSCEGRRYKIYEPGMPNTPLAETDEPVTQEQHDTFQRLYKHWGYWFLRINGYTKQADYEITGSTVSALAAPIETSMYILSTSREQMLGDFDHDAASDSTLEREQIVTLLDKFEALTGPGPVPRTGTPRVPGKVNAWVIHRSHPPRTQWVTLDRANLIPQLRKIMGGQFVSMVFENVRSGVDMVQMLSQDPNNKRAPDIWLRLVRGVPTKQVGETQILGPIGRSLPLEEFKPEGVTSLEADDVPVAINHYQRTTSTDNAMSTVARLQQAPDDDSPSVDKATHEAIVQNYLQLCQIVRTAASAADVNAQRVWPMLRDAVIFELPTIAYHTLYEEFFNYCVKVARVDPKIPITDHTAKQRKRVMDVIGTGVHAPFPEKLPFKSCFFAYGRGVRDANADLLEEDLRKKEPNAPPSVGKLYGHLVTDTGLVVNFRHIERGANGQEGLVFVFDRDPTSIKGQCWDRVHTLSPWIINALVSYVNEHKKLVEAGPNGFGYKSLVKKLAKGLAMTPPVPRPFYVVYLKDEVIREHARQRTVAIKREIDWQHRWNVRGHDCIRYTRGPLPIDSETEAALLKRRYKIFTDTQPDSQTFMALAKRGIPPKAEDEWLAVLSVWRESFVKGPSDKPLIESVRRSTKDWEIP